MTEEKATPLFNKGDKVLCYEPNPCKQPVIYHSVIMDIDYEDVYKYGEEEKKVEEGEGGEPHKEGGEPHKEEGEPHVKEVGEEKGGDEKKGGVEKNKGVLQPIYHVHFQNWGHRNDRWVTENLLLPITPENMALKAQYDKAVPAAIANNKRIRRSGTKKCATPNTQELQSSFKMNLTLPPTIKVALERDFVNVTLRNLLIALPRSPNVETILSLFEKYTIANHPAEDLVSLREFTEGITTCFDFTLPLQLLYKEERSQLEREGYVYETGARVKRQQLVTESGDDHVTAYPGFSDWARRGPDNIPGPLQPSKLYGAEHLLRLFVKLPEFLDHMERKFLKNVEYFSQLFLEYVAWHRAEVFVEVQPYKEADLCDLG